ncbi:unnamed protein product [Cunninghamella blakesleeana]
MLIRIHLFIICIIICIYFILPIDGIYHPTDDYSDVYSHSYFVTLKQPNLCGGTIISNPTLPSSASSFLWILTAAHCFQKDKKKENEDDIGLLIINQLSESSSITFSISNQVHQHPDFIKTTTMDSLDSLFDIALIQIPLFDLPKNNMNEIIPLPLLPYSSDSSNELECMGIGSTKRNASSIDNDVGIVLHTTECYSLSTSTSPSSTPLHHQPSYLSGIFTEYIKKNQTILTTTFPLASLEDEENDNNISLCHGDSGSALILHQPNEKEEGNNYDQPYFIGILSKILYAMDHSSFICPESSNHQLPMVNVYIQPYYHLDWISTTTQLPISFLTVSSI